LISQFEGGIKAKKNSPLNGQATVKFAKSGGEAGKYNFGLKIKKCLKVKQLFKKKKLKI